jgi:hypothetical protein
MERQRAKAKSKIEQLRKENAELAAKVEKPGFFGKLIGKKKAKATEVVASDGTTPEVSSEEEKAPPKKEVVAKQPEP